MFLHSALARGAAKLLAYPPPRAENETRHSGGLGAPCASAHRSNPPPPFQSRPLGSANPWPAALARYFGNAPKVVFRAQSPPHWRSADRNCLARPPARTLLRLSFAKPKLKEENSSARNTLPRKFRSSR